MVPAAEDGIQELYRPEGDAEIDIVAVHGITGDAVSTWTSEPGNTCWLSDPEYLPKYLKNARVLSWGYDAQISSVLRMGSGEKILQHAQTLVAQLQADRELEGANDRPIIFICHSLGGIIVKRALIYSASRNSPKLSHLHTIYTCTYSIFFFGTPHLGFSKAYRKLHRKRSITISRGRIKYGWGLWPIIDETLQNIVDQFTTLMPDFRIFFFWEQDYTKLKSGKPYHVVNETSAAPILDGTDRCGVPAEHAELCRFKSNSSSSFRTVVAAIRRHSKAAPPLIRARCAKLEEHRQRQALETMHVIGGGGSMDQMMDDEDVIAASLFLQERKRTLHRELAEITAATQWCQGMHMDETQAEAEQIVAGDPEALELTQSMESRAGF